LERISGEFEFLGAGRYYIALDLPDRNAVLKFLRPEGPRRKSRKRWRRWLRRKALRARRIALAAAADRAFRTLAESKSFTLSNCFPETEIADDLDVTYEMLGQTLRYSGSAYVQCKVQFFDNHTPLDSFDWEAIAEVQHRLWRMGVGLGSGAETWGPKNWCHTNDGKTRLADLSSLSPDLDLVRKRLSNTTRELRRRKLRKYQPVDCRPQIERYLAFVSDRLRRESLDQLWRADC